MHHVKDIIRYAEAYQVLKTCNAEMKSAREFGFKNMGVPIKEANRRWLIVNSARGLINEFCVVDEHFKVNSNAKLIKMEEVLDELKKEFRLQQVSWADRKLCQAEINARVAAWEYAQDLIFEIRNGRGGLLYTVVKEARQGKLFVAA